VSEEKIVQRGYRIAGRVQGVFFRAWTRETALGLGLGGTVRNCSDGSVEAHLVGPVDVVEEMESRLREGPPASRVRDVQRIDSPGPLPRKSFSILH